MTLSETYSWIFYAIGIASKNKPASIAEIERVADGINHAVPTQKELQVSMLWLKKQGLIIKAGKKIELSEDGIDLMNKLSFGVQATIGVWKQIESHFADIGINNSVQVNPNNYDHRTINSSGTGRGLSVSDRCFTCNLLLFSSRRRSSPPGP